MYELCAVQSGMCICSWLLVFVVVSWGSSSKFLEYVNPPHSRGISRFCAIKQ